MTTLFILLQIVLWDSMPNAIIHQDSTIQMMMEEHWGMRVRGQQEIPGWRVQIYSSNNQLAAKQQAEELKLKFEQVLAEPIYVDFMQPFWKVRVGNFQTIDEAKAYRDQLVEQFPELQSESYPVRAIITIVQ